MSQRSEARQSAQQADNFPGHGFSQNNEHEAVPGPELREFHDQVT